MKKIKFLALAIMLAGTSTTYAQWSNTGDSKTTGSLTIGSDVNNSTSYLKILGPNSPTTEVGKRDISFEFKGAGQSVIRAHRSGGWGNNLEFLTTVNNSSLVKRLNFNYLGKTYLYDNEVWIGQDGGSAAVGTTGSKLIFGGTDWANSIFSLYKYITGTRASDLRLNLGSNNSGQNKFVIGNYDVATPTVWRNLFVVSDNGSVGINTTPNASYKLSVNGTIRAKEVRVETGWADFVFQPDYELPTLQEVKAHIEENGHLPGIPSEAEVRENGVGLSEATTLLLQKVEELTLYAIQQSETIEKLNQRIDELESQK